MIGLAVISDGRTEYLKRTLESVEENLIGIEHVMKRWVCLDNASALDEVLRMARPLGYAVHSYSAKQGLSGIVRSAWRTAIEQRVEYLFHLEEDFTFNQKVYLNDLRDVLDEDSRIAQVVLKRQPWSEAEIKAGGFVQINPRLYLDVMVGGHQVALHKRGFSKNPCLMPRRIFSKPYSDAGEGGFGDELVASGYHFALLGCQLAPPVVTHIGDRRGEGWRR